MCTLASLLRMYFQQIFGRGQKSSSRAVWIGVGKYLLAMVVMTTAFFGLSDRGYALALECGDGIEEDSSGLDCPYFFFNPITNSGNVSVLSGINISTWSQSYPGFLGTVQAINTGTVPTSLVWNFDFSEWIADLPAGCVVDTGSWLNIINQNTYKAQYSAWYNGSMFSWLTHEQPTTKTLYTRNANGTCNFNDPIPYQYVTEGCLFLEWADGVQVEESIQVTYNGQPVTATLDTWSNGSYKYHQVLSYLRSEPIEYSEECDDGNTNNGDGCNEFCEEEYCGDGVTQAALGEACDDGNSQNNDACTNNCQLTYCGDGIWQSQNGAGTGGVANNGQEQCDDGNTNNNDNCKNDCTLNTQGYCGNGQVDPGEECDDGEAGGFISNGNNNYDECTNWCTIPTCGDGVVMSGSFTPRPNSSVKGPGGLGAGGNNTGCQGGAPDGICSSLSTYFGGSETAYNCVADCGPQAFSGYYEACDDGNTENGDGCNEFCEEEYCGDGVVQAGLGEECDPAIHDGCSIPTEKEAGCKWIEPMCEISTNTPSIYRGDTAYISIDVYPEENNGIEYGRVSWGDGTTSNYAPNLGHAYSTTGTHTVQFYAANVASSVVDSCDQEIYVGRCGDSIMNGPEECDGAGQAQCGEGAECMSCQCIVAGVCGEADGQSFYSTGAGNGLSSDSIELCASGFATGFSYNSDTHTRTWLCQGGNQYQYYGWSGTVGGGEGGGKGGDCGDGRLGDGKGGCLPLLQKTASYNPFTKIITFTITGEVPPYTNIVDISDVLTGGTFIYNGEMLYNFQATKSSFTPPYPTLNFSSKDGKGGYNQFSTSFGNPGPMTGEFVITLWATGTNKVCNQAMMGVEGEMGWYVYSDNPYTTAPSDPACITYDLSLQKSVQQEWNANTYPENIKGGTVYDGDWFVYRIQASSNGPLDSSNVVVADTLPAGVVAFWHANPQPVMPGMSFTPGLPNATSFTWTIPYLAAGQSTGFDLFVKFSSGNYTDEQIIINTGAVYVGGNPASAIDEVNPNNNQNSASIQYIDACERDCEGEIYATGFAWSVQGNTLTVNASCVVEATCGDSGEFPATPAQLVYGTSQINTSIVGNQIVFQLPSDTAASTSDTITVNNISSCSGNSTCIRNLVASAINTADGLSSDFQNYNFLTNTFNVNGSTVSFSVQTRVWRHWLSCEKDVAWNVSNLYRSYELTLATWTGISHFTVTGNQTLTATTQGNQVTYQRVGTLNRHSLTGHIDNCPIEEYCGDAIQNGTEQCDDGMHCTNGTQCTADAECAGIGDGLCLARSNDGCSATCQVEEEDPYCGDGMVDPGEDCDYGTGNSNILPNTCRNDCTWPVCGDTVIDTGFVVEGTNPPLYEACDDGNTANNDLCNNFCQLTYCGDGFKQTPNGQGQVEACDDGNNVGGDGCSALCEIESIEDPYCGDGTTNGEEECDDANSNNNDTCTNSCTLTYCGDTIIQAPNGSGGLMEQCDYGASNGQPGSNCAIDCTWVNSCGDGVLDANGDDDIPGTADDEECDRGPNNGTGAGQCRPDCKLPTCGDGTIDPGEQCDDGDTEDGDGCSAICMWEAEGPSEECEAYELRCGDLTITPAYETCDGQAGCALTCDWLMPNCNLDVSQTTVYLGNPVTFTMSYSTGTDFHVTNLNFGDGTDAAPASSVPHTYSIVGTFTATFSVLNMGNGGISTECQETVTVVRGCGDGTIDAGEQCGEPGLSCGDGALCNTNTCKCEQMCEWVADETNYNEECDRGAANGDNARCTNTCQFNVCGDGFTGTNMYVYTGDMTLSGWHYVNASGATIQYNQGTAWLLEREECDPGYRCTGNINQNCHANPDVCDDNGWGTCAPYFDGTCTSDSCEWTICGDGQVHSTTLPNSQGIIEECDDGSRCSDGSVCTTNEDCNDIGDEVCKARPGYGCSPFNQANPATSCQDEYCGDSIVNNNAPHLLISKNPVTNEAGNGNSSVGSVSSGGRYVVFNSASSNLVAGDSNGQTDVFVYDAVTESMKNITSGGNGGSSSANISADGRYVSFISSASNLVAGDTNGYNDIFLYDIQSGTMKNITLGSNVRDNTFNGNRRATMSADGRYVVFESKATNLTAGDPYASNPNNAGNYIDIFMYDRVTDTMHKITDGANNNSDSAKISDNGRYITFESAATNLTAGDTTTTPWDIFVYDRELDTFENITMGHDVNLQFSDISDDGRWVALYSNSTNLVSGQVDPYTLRDTFLYDRENDVMKQISYGATGGDVSIAAISANGRYVQIASAASNLVPGDSNGVADIFIYDRVIDKFQKVSTGTTAAGSSPLTNMSADGRYLIYQQGGQIYRYDHKHPGETCDQGGANSANGSCTNLCQVNVCGDGYVLAGVEQCDNGPANGIPGGTCNTQCQLTLTEDGICGELDDTAFYHPDHEITAHIDLEDLETAWGDDISYAMLCSGANPQVSYNPVTFGYNGSTWSWQCAGLGAEPAPTPASCTITEMYCGDGSTQAAYGEECDQGANNGQPGYNCSVDCRVPEGSALCNIPDDIPYDAPSNYLDTYPEPLCLGSGAQTVGLSYNAETQTWTWDCHNAEDEWQASCSATAPSCGDGILQGTEVCDDGNLVDGDGCSATCTIEPPLLPEFGASCVGRGLEADEVDDEVGTLWPINNDEYLPIWWQLAYADGVDTTATSCADIATGKIFLADDMQCLFTIYQGSVTGPVPVHEFRAACDSDMWDDHTLFAGLMENAAFNPISGDDDTSPLGNFYLDPAEVTALVNNVFGQYQVALTDIQYTICHRVVDGDGNVSITPQNGNYLSLGNENLPPICTANVSITEGFLVQKGTSLIEVENTQIDNNYISIDGVNLVVQGTPIDEAVNQATALPQGAGREYLVNQIIDSYNSLARERVTIASVTLDKVPAQPIYFYRGVTTEQSPLVVNDSFATAIRQHAGGPFTLVVTRASLQVGPARVVIPGSLGELPNGMRTAAADGLYVVDGTITFDSGESCSETDVVLGVFVASQGFQTNSTRNNNLSAEWCDAGNLIIKGLLVGAQPDLNTTFSHNRRSVIDYRTPETYLFDDSLVGKARATFQTCYLPAILNQLNSTTPHYQAEGFCNNTNRMDFREEAMKMMIGGTFVAEGAGPARPYQNHICKAYREVYPQLQAEMNTNCTIEAGCSNMPPTVNAQDCVSLANGQSQLTKDYETWMVINGGETPPRDDKISVLSPTSPWYRAAMKYIMEGKPGSPNDPATGTLPWIVNSTSNKPIKALGTLANMFVNAGNTEFGNIYNELLNYSQTLANNIPFEDSSWIFDWINQNYLVQQQVREGAVFNGASVLIEIDPDIWSTLPEVANEFLQGLQITR